MNDHEYKRGDRVLVRAGLTKQRCIVLGPHPDLEGMVSVMTDEKGGGFDTWLPGGLTRVDVASFYPRDLERI